MEKINKKAVYRAVAIWNEEKNTFKCSFGKETIEVAAAPAQFRMPKEAWSPEELFLGSLKSFLQESFIDYAKRSNFEFLSYESEAKGVMEKVGDKLMFSEIEIRPYIVVASSSQIGKAKELISAAKENCFIFSSLAAMIMVYPEIKAKF